MHLDLLDQMITDISKYIQSTTEPILILDYL